MFLGSLCFATSDAAADTGEIRAALADGRFAEAERTGAVSGTPEGQALAAAAAYLQGFCPETQSFDQRQQHFQRAFDLTTQAIAEPDAIGRTWFWRAWTFANLLERRSKDMSIGEAMEASDELDALFNRAVALDPRSALIRAARSRIEIGKLVESRRFTLGAASLVGDRSRAIADACRALGTALSSESPEEKGSVAYIVADGLWSWEPARYRPTIIALLDVINEPCDGDAVCRCYQSQSRSLRRDVEAGPAGDRGRTESLCPGLKGLP